MGNTISINDGLKIYDIANQNGEIIGQFKINPADSGMIERYRESLERLEDAKAQFSQADDSAETFIKLQELVVNELRYIVGNDTVKVFFDVMGAFSPQGGKFYYENILEIISGLIEKEGKKEMAAMKKRIEKYGKRYQ